MQCQNCCGLQKQKEKIKQRTSRRSCWKRRGELLLQHASLLLSTTRPKWIDVCRRDEVKFGIEMYFLMCRLREGQVWRHVNFGVVGSWHPQALRRIVRGQAISSQYFGIVAKTELISRRQLDCNTTPQPWVVFTAKERVSVPPPSHTLDQSLHGSSLHPIPSLTTSANLLERVPPHRKSASS